MKKIQLSVITLLGYSTLLMAGGDIQEITPFEIEVHVVKESTGSWREFCNMYLCYDTNRGEVKWEKYDFFLYKLI